MDIGQVIDLYCERTGPGLWAEPLNLVSNAAFLIAAFAAWIRSRALTGGQRGPVFVLCGFLGAIGVGSALFHSFATLWAQALDVGPIGLYILTTLNYWLRDAHGDSPGQRLVAMSGLVMLSGIFGVLVPPELVNGSQGYFGVLVFMFWLAYRERYGRVPGYFFAGTTGIFALSLLCRTVDMSVCPSWPLGTHFLWHMLNALVCYLPLRAYVAVRLSHPP